MATPSQLPTMGSNLPAICEALRDVPGLRAAYVFGSVGRGEETSESDLDVALSTTSPLDVQTKLKLVERLAEFSGRPIDLVDLDTVGEPLLGEILAKGLRLVGEPDVVAGLLIRHMRERADFLPYRRRILDTRRARWTGM